MTVFLSEKYIIGGLLVWASGILLAPLAGHEVHKIIREEED